MANQWRGASVEVKQAISPDDPDFAGALRALKAGKKTRRATWPRGTYLQVVKPPVVTEPAIEMALPFVVCFRPDKTAVPYSPGHDSLLAEDWELVE